MKTIFSNSFFICLVTVFSVVHASGQVSGSEEWTKAEGVIKEIKQNVHVRTFRRQAAIEFVSDEGDTLVGIGDVTFDLWSGAGDQVRIYYKKSNPAILHTFIGKMVEEYGWFMLIGLGVIISSFRLLKIRKSAKKAK